MKKYLFTIESEWWKLRKHLFYFTIRNWTMKIMEASVTFAGKLIIYLGQQQLLYYIFSTKKIQIFVILEYLSIFAQEIPWFSPGFYCSYHLSICFISTVFCCGSISFISNGLLCFYSRLSTARNLLTVAMVLAIFLWSFL